MADDIRRIISALEKHLTGTKAADNGEAAGDDRDPSSLLDALKARLAADGLDWSESLDAVPDPIFLHDTDFRVIRCNKAYAERAGLSAERIIGRRYYEVFPRLDAPLEGVPRTPDGDGGEPMASELKTEDGAIYLNRGFSLRRGKAGPRYAIHLLQDVTEQRRSEEALRHSHELIERLFSNVHMLLAYMDREFNFIRVNEAYARAGNHPPSYFVGRNHFELYPHGENEQLFRQVVARGEPYHIYDKAFSYPDQPERGTTYWDWSLVPVGEGDRVTGVLLMLREVTEHRRVQRELEASGRRLRTLIDASPDLVCLEDARGRWMEANTAAEAFFGLDGVKWRGQPIGDLVAQSSRPGILDAFRRDEGVAWGARRPTRSRQTLADRTFDIVRVPLFDEDRERTGLVTIARDVTEQHQAEEALEHRIQLEEVVGRISRRFLELDSGAIDQAVEETLATIAQTAAVHRAYVFEFVGDGALMHNTYEWCAPNVRSQLSERAYLPTHHLAWWVEKLKRFETISISRSADLPDAAADLRTFMEREDVGAVIAAPMIFEGRLIGFAGFEHLYAERRWEEADVRLLRVASDVIVNAIQHHRANSQLRRLNRALQTVSRCNEAIARAEDELSLLQKVCEVITSAGGYRLAWVGYAQHDPERSVRPVAQGGYEAGYLDRIRISWREDDPYGRGPTGSAIRLGKPCIVRDMHRDPAFAPWREEAIKRGYNSSIGLPLRNGERVFGALMIYAEEADAFDAEEETLLTELAEDLSFGIEAQQTRADKLATEATLRLRNRAIEVAHNGIVIVGAESGLPIRYVNPAFERITGYGKAEVLGRSPKLLLGEDHDQPEMENIRHAIRTGSKGRAVLRNYRKDGSLFWNELSVSAVYDENGATAHFVGIINDVTAHKRYEAQLEYQSHYDDLTGLANRNLLNDRLGQALAYARRYDRLAAVLFIDIDRFKLINDSLGHPAGDEVLKQAARALERCTRQGDTVARYAGDEFVVVLSDIDGPGDVSAFAERALEAVASPFDVDSQELRISASIGASLYPRDSSDATALLKNADAAMHQVKEQGRGGFRFFTSDLNARAMARLTLEGELRRALERDELLLHYQPQVDLQSGAIIGMEALVRWEHPERGMVSPGEFIPLAEETGLIVPLGEWVLHTACRQAREWRNAGFAQCTMAVNLSAHQLSDPNVEERVVGALQEAGLSAGHLELELTESAIMADPDEMLAKLRRLSDNGLQLALDDFGTGFSSLSHVKLFPFDRLKIDQSFIRNIISNPHDSAIALAIIDMARRLRLRVIAEGVESESQLRYLQRHGCEQVQGYYLSRPMAAADATAVLTRGAFPDVPRKADEMAAQTLLVVDGEPDVTSAIGHLLRGEPFEVLTVNDPDQVFEEMARRPAHVVLAGRTMPGLDGMELLSRIRELYPETVRLLLGDVDISTGDDCIHRFIASPWRDQELLEAVHAAFRQYAVGGRPEQYRTASAS